MVINGRDLSKRIYDEIVVKNYENIRLAIILANHDESSRKYTELKKAAGEKINIQTDIYTFDEKSTKDDLINKIIQLNNDESIHGIVVQLPLFPHLESTTFGILEKINPDKDCDGLTSHSLSTTFNYDNNSILPAAVEAVMVSLESVVKLTEIKGKNILIVNNSNLIGNPLALTLSNLNATVTIANEFTKDLLNLSLEADIIISATGVTNIFSDKDVKNGAIIIDVTSVSKDGRVFGDFIYDEKFISKVGSYTPVPGGIGPLTVASLFKNLIKLYERGNK